MIQSLGIRFTNYLKQNIPLSDDEQAKINYAFQLIVGDLSKLAIMLILFSCLGVGIQFLMATLTLMMIRPFTGGLHFKTYLGCLVFSILFFAMVIYCNAYFYKIPYLAFYLYIVGSLIFAVTPSQPGPTRPNYSTQQRKQFKLKLFAIIGIHFLFLTHLKYNLYLTLSSWVIFIQALQLLISKGGFQHEIQNANQSINKCR